MQSHGTLSQLMLLQNSPFGIGEMIQRLRTLAATQNLIEEKVGSTLEHIGTGDHFLNITPVPQTLREAINEWDLLKLKSFCKAKDMVNKTKMTAYRMGRDFHQPLIRQ